MPVGVLDELVELRSLVVHVARHLFKKANPKRERVPRGFADSFKLVLTSIEEGSAVPVLARVRDAERQQDLLGQTDYFDLAVDTVLGTITAANNNTEVDLPPSMIRRFDRLGRRLADGESIEFEKPGGITAVYSRDTRLRLLRLAGGTELTVEAELRGPVVSVNDDSPYMTFDVRIGHGKTASVPYEQGQRDSVIAALTNKWSVRCVLDATAVRSAEGALVRVADVGEWEFEDAVLEDQLDRLRERFSAIHQLQAGWMNGLGEAPLTEVLDYGEKAAIALLAEFDEPHDVFLYPTPDGGIRCEWETASWEFALEIDEAGVAVLSAVNHEGEDELYETINGDEFSVAQRVAEFLSQVVEPEQ